MGKIFIINDTNVTGGVDATHDLGTSTLTWRHCYLSGTITVGTVSATGAIIGSGTLTIGTVSATGNIVGSATLTISTGTIVAAKITATTGSFTALLTAGTASVSGAIIGGTTITVGTVSATGNIVGDSTGSGFYLKEGTNASMGTVTLVSGTANVVTTKVTANSRIFLTAEGTGAIVGALGVGTRSAGTSFSIQSSSALDDRNIGWIIFEPA